jgi:CRISPR-associated protein Cas8b1/Cst1 subtype I-B
MCLLCTKCDLVLFAFLFSQSANIEKSLSQFLCNSTEQAKHSDIKNNQNLNISSKSNQKENLLKKFQNIVLSQHEKKNSLELSFKNKIMSRLLFLVLQIR